MTTFDGFPSIHISCIVRLIAAHLDVVLKHVTVSASNSLTTRKDRAVEVKFSVG